MFNPLAPWTPEALSGFVEEGHRFFVRQTFDRGREPFDEKNTGCFLLCHYKDAAPAKEHYDALGNDPHRFLYDWDNEAHRERLERSADGLEGFKIYTNTFLPNWEQHITRRIKQHIRLYIQQKGWNPKRNEGVHIDFYPHFGEVMIILKFGGREVRVPFADIEKVR